MVMVSIDLTDHVNKHEFHNKVEVVYYLILPIMILGKVRVRTLATI